MICLVMDFKTNDSKDRGNPKNSKAQEVVLARPNGLVVGFVVTLDRFLVEFRRTVDAFDIFDESSISEDWVLVRMFLVVVVIGFVAVRVLERLAFTALVDEVNCSIIISW